MHDTIQAGLPNLRMIAHRGVSGLERENTCAAFVAAGNRSYWGIETDVHRTRDGQFIIIHDDSTKRVADVAHLVEETDLATLRAISLRDLAGEPRGDLVFPTLDEYIRICKQYRKEAVLELKNRFSPEDVGRIIAIIQAEGWLDHTVFISFSYENCACVRRLLPQQPGQYLCNAVQEDTIEKLLAHHLDLDVHWEGVTQAQVHACAAHGIRVNCWTCDDADVARRLASWGVTYLTTNILE